MDSKYGKVQKIPRKNQISIFSLSKNKISPITSLYHMAKEISMKNCKKMSARYKQI